MSTKVVPNNFGRLCANRNEELNILITLTIAVCEVGLSWIWRKMHCRWHTCRVKKESRVEYL
jgi:hypothetical protein